MKNKGFTLIELLAVIIVIGIIAAITSGIIINNLSSSKSKSEEIQKNNILSVAKAYVSENLNDFLSGSKYDCSQNGNVRTCNLNSSILVSENYLEQPKDLNEPDKNINYNIKITFELDGHKIKNVDYEVENKTEFVKDSFKNYILKYNTVKENPNFSSSSTDKGLYVQQGDSSKSVDGKPTYYFRGNVENNYVKLGQYIENVTQNVYSGPNYDETVSTQTYALGDSILWRIVRINEDGTIRLISENIINNSSTSTNIFSNTNLVQGNYCEDLTETDIEHNVGFMYAGFYRSSSPVFTCPSQYLKNTTIGELSIDEYYFADAGNSNSYLENLPYNWTLAAGSYSSASERYVIPAHENTGYASYGARIVINLKSDVTIDGGNGTKANPYVIK